MFSEQVTLVRSALARIIGTVAKLSFPQGTWPQLMQLLWQLQQARPCAKPLNTHARARLVQQQSLKCLLIPQQSDTPQHKETAMSVLGSMFDSMRSHMQPHLASLLQILSTNLSHPHALVRRGALQATPNILPTDFQSHILCVRLFK